jgi:opacity protein-like surface antigen
MTRHSRLPRRPKGSENKTGFNVGADIGFKLSRNVGVGGLFRYSHASLSFPLAGSAANVNADAAGPQVAGGLRLFF